VKQSLAGYIRQHLVELEARMEFGTKQAELVEELNALGYATTLPAFRNYLSRARAWRDRKGKEPSTKATTAARPAAPKSAGPSGFEYPGSPGDDELSELI
jgi:hypothetical protein